jgi:hypothetical protein
MTDKCLAHFMLIVDLIALILFCEGYKLRSSLLSNFLKSSVTAFSLRVNVLITFLKHLQSYSCLDMRDLVPQSQSLRLQEIYSLVRFNLYVSIGCWKTKGF